MSNDKTVECVVAFDHVAVATGETVGTPPIATSTDHFKGDKVTLSEHDAKRHLETGAVVKASDPRAKHISPNPSRNTGVVRTVDAVPLEQTAPAVSAGEGAARDASSEAELRKMGAAQVKARAAELGITLDRTDTKPTTIQKILAAQSSAPATVGAEGAGPGETVNPGQGDEPADPAPSAAAVTTE